MEYAANLNNRLHQRVVCDSRVGPEFGHQLVFGHQPVPLLNQIDENLQRLWPQELVDAIAPDTAAREIDHDFAQTIDWLVGTVHPRLSG